MSRDWDDEDVPAPSGRHQKAGRAATRRRRVELQAGPAGLVELLNLVHRHPVPITYKPRSASVPKDAPAILRRAVPTPITHEAVSASLTEYSPELLAGLRALPDEWRPNFEFDTPPPALLVPFWTALTSIALAVELMGETKNPRATRVSRFVHKRMAELQREALECWVRGGALPADQPLHQALNADTVYGFHCEAARHLLEAFWQAPTTWLRRLRRCAFPGCEQPYMLDRSPGRVERPATITAWHEVASGAPERRQVARERRREYAVADKLAAETGLPADLFREIGV